MLNGRLTWRILLSACLIFLFYLVIALSYDSRKESGLARKVTAFGKHINLPKLSVFSSNPSISSANTTTTSELPAEVDQPTKFDIVISYYNENLTDVAKQLDGLKSIPQLEQYSETRVVIYTKNPDVDREMLQSTLGGTVVLLPNKGREAGAYLAHILSSWDDLADHTMFVQALMHFPNEATRKAQDYLAPPIPGQPSTGLLTMGYLSNCQCTSCHDAWDGGVTWSRVAELYVLLNDELCPKDIIITYLGQFIVSRKRILQREKKVYQYIKDVLESDLEHWIHTDPRRDDFKDSPDNPYFGHSMERAWMVLWDCDDLKMLESCGNGLHSLLNIREKDDPIERCQCMDQ